MENSSLNSIFFEKHLANKIWICCLVDWNRHSAQEFVSLDKYIYRNDIARVLQVDCSQWFPVWHMLIPILHTTLSPFAEWYLIDIQSAKVDAYSNRELNAYTNCLWVLFVCCLKIYDIGWTISEFHCTSIFNFIFKYILIMRITFCQFSYLSHVCLSFLVDFCSFFQCYNLLLSFFFQWKKILNHLVSIVSEHPYDIIIIILCYHSSTTC